MLDARAARVTLTVLVILGLVALLWLLRKVLLLVAFAMFFAYLIWPLVTLAQGVVGRRRPALTVGLVYLVLLLVLTGAGTAVGPRLREEVGNLAQKLPEMSKQLGTGELVGTMLESRGWAAEPIRLVQSYIATHTGEIIQYAQQAVANLLKWLTGAWVVVLVPIFAFFILKDAQEVRAAIDAMIDRGDVRALVHTIASDIHVLLAGYVRALLLLSLVTFAVWSIVFLIARVPYGMVLAAIGGTFEFIPVLGPLVAGVVVVGVSVFAGISHPWLLVAFIILWRFVQDYVTSPLVMGRGVEVHPALVIAGVIAGGEIGGPAGMFLSVPIIAAVRIVWRRLRAYHDRPR
jgi:predicted PurR-regulated permease PerM